MGFGASFTEQLQDINTYTSNGISLLSDFRDFLKEKAEIEKVYAASVDKLAKNYSKKFKKSGQSFYGSGTNFQSGDNEALGTLANAFLRILTETENMAKSRNTLLEHLSNDVSNSLKFEIKRKEEARVKHMNFASTLSKNFEAQKTETDGARSAYRNAGKEVDSAYTKYDKAPDNPDKFTKEWNEALLEKFDAKNNYSLSYTSLVTHKTRHYQNDMPILMDHLQDLNEHLINRGRDIMIEFVDIENNSLNELQACTASIMDALNLVNAAQDSQLFINLISKNLPEVTLPSFEPYSESESEALTVEPSNVWLLNKLQQLLLDVEKSQKDIAGQQKQIDGIQNLKDAYERDPKLGDPVEVWQNVIESGRQLQLFEMTNTKSQSQIDKIKGTLGDVRLTQHQMKGVSSGTCVVCNTSMSLFSKGNSCTACSIKCHTKCTNKIPPLCGQDYTPPTQLQPQAQGSNFIMKTGTSTTNLVSNQKMPTVGSARVLYDFPKSEEGELAVRAGDVINLTSFDDGSGWVTAELNGQRGAVPANYIEVIQNPTGNSSRSEKVRALYDYAPQSGEELSLKVGDIIEVTNKSIGGGWWEGKLNGKIGQFPENYVEPA